MSLLPINHLIKTLDRCCGQWEFEDEPSQIGSMRSFRVRLLNTNIVYCASFHEAKWYAHDCTHDTSSEFLANRLNGLIRDDAGTPQCDLCETDYVANDGDTCGTCQAEIDGDREAIDGWRTIPNPSLDTIVQAGDEVSWNDCDWQKVEPHHVGQPLSMFFGNGPNLQLRRRVAELPAEPIVEAVGALLCPVIFLDIDGVLNNHQQMENHYCGTNRDCVSRFNRILDAVPAAKIVVSSAWRYMILRGDVTLKGFEMLLLTHGIKCHERIIGHTVADGPVDQEPSHTDSESWNAAGLRWRREQIHEWAFRHGIKTYVAIDDLHLDMNQQVWIDGEQGLQDSDVDLIIEKLTGPLDVKYEANDLPADFDCIPEASEPEASEPEPERDNVTIETVNGFAIGLQLWSADDRYFGKFYVSKNGFDYLHKSGYVAKGAYYFESFAEAKEAAKSYREPALELVTEASEPVAFCEGDWVVCVDNERYENDLVINKAYRLRGVRHSDFLLEGSVVWWYQYRFRRARPDEIPPQPDSEGWIVHSGTECPVEDGTLVDVRYRNGKVVRNVPANINTKRELDAWKCFWDKQNDSHDIVAYRPVTPAPIPALPEPFTLEELTESYRSLPAADLEPVTPASPQSEHARGVKVISAVLGIQPAPKQYRPFASATEFLPLADRWIKSEQGYWRPAKIGKLGVHGNNEYYSFEYLFHYFKFEDGTPCGVEVSE